jgi:membrane protein YdbS with pleckstrin-like domain
MSVKQIWSDMGNDQDNDLSSLIRQAGLSKRPSKNPLQKIRQGLLMNIGWGILISIGYVAIIFYFPIWIVQLCMSVVLMFTIWAVYTAWIQYKKIQLTQTAGGTLLDEMRTYYDSVTEWMRTQQRVALFIYPVSAAGGFFLGGVLGSGKPVEYFMGKPFFLIMLVVCVVVLVPVCYYVARWLFNYSFGKYLLALKQNITALEEEK